MLQLGDFDRVHVLYYDVLHPSLELAAKDASGGRVQVQWEDVHAYALFLMGQRLPMRAFRIIRKAGLVGHPVVGFLAAECDVALGREEERLQHQQAKYQEALEIVQALRDPTSSSSSSSSPSAWEQRRRRLIAKIHRLLEQDYNDDAVTRDDTTSMTKDDTMTMPKNDTDMEKEASPYNRDLRRVCEAFALGDYERVLATCDVYGQSVVAIPQPMLTRYLYALHRLARVGELRHLAQWLVDEQGHLPEAWYAVALHYWTVGLGLDGHAADGNVDEVGDQSMNEQMPGTFQEHCRRYLLKSIAKDQTFVEGYLALGLLYSGRTGDHDLAVRALTAAMANARCQHRPDFLRWATIALTTEYLRVKKPEEALKLLDSLHHPQHPQYPHQRTAVKADEPGMAPDVANELAVSLYQLRRLPEAYGVACEALQCDNIAPSIKRCLSLNAASVACRLGDYARARDHLQCVMSPTNFQASSPSSSSHHHHHQDQHSSQSQSSKHQHQHLSSSTLLYYWKLRAVVGEVLGRRTLDAGELARALDAYSAALCLQPEDVVTRESYGQCLQLYKYLRHANHGVDSLAIIGQEDVGTAMDMDELIIGQE
jgi:tetratricopeptide (TPR) repeat protein